MEPLVQCYTATMTKSEPTIVYNLYDTRVGNVACSFPC